MILVIRLYILSDFSEKKLYVLLDFEILLKYNISLGKILSIT